MKYRSEADRGKAASDSLRESTSTTSMGGAVLNYRSPSRSSIFDVSRMSGVKPPVNSAGYDAAAFTKDLAHTKSNHGSSFLRVLFIAIGFPLLGIAAYLTYTGQELHLDAWGNRSVHEPIVRATPTDPLPEAAPVDLATRTPAAVIPLVTAAAPIHIATEDEPRPLTMTLDSKGRVISPYSFVLNEDGFEIERHPLKTDLELSPKPSASAPPAAFHPAIDARPFLYTQTEIRRILQLRQTAPEVRSTLRAAEAFSISRLGVSPAATWTLTAQSFMGGEENLRVYGEALTELLWLRSAAQTSNINGDRTLRKRIYDVLILWMKTYKPSGNALLELPLLGLVHAYDYMRSDFTADDRIAFDAFLRDLVDKQAESTSRMKTFDGTHAAHALLMLAVGYVIGDGPLQYHGLGAYQKHLEAARWLDQDAYSLQEGGTLRSILQCAILLERAGEAGYKSARLKKAISTFANGAQGPESQILISLGMGAYFLPELYPLLAKRSVDLGIESRFGSGQGALLAATRKATTSLDETPTPVRAPASLPKPQKARKTR